MTRKRIFAGACLAAVLALLMPTDALAQSRTYYGADGHVTGRSSTSSSGTTTIYGADGRKAGSITTTKPQRSK